jgi:acyl-CoA reductase-like NAD-dependent aldehyde dehydrogenase
MDVHKNLISGAWVDGADTAPNVNPSDPKDVVGLYARGDAAAVDTAVAAARAALPGWASSSPQVRHDVLEAAGAAIIARKDEIGRLLSREEGKTLAEGIGETMRAAQIFKFFAGEALRLGGEVLPSVRPCIDVMIEREPVGVVGLITPWNFPIAIPAWKARPRAGLRELCYHEACGPHAGMRLGNSTPPEGSWLSGRRIQLDYGTW